MSHCLQLKKSNIMELSFYIVDAFIDPSKPFSGNPAAVVPVKNDDEINDLTKQKIASQFNLSETVFITKEQSPDASKLIRWFTPKSEVPLCGHATLAASAVLFNESLNQDLKTVDNTLKFITKFGSNLRCIRDKNEYILDFPLNEPVPVTANQFEWLNPLKQAILGQANNNLEQVFYSSTTKKLLLRLRDDTPYEVLHELAPNFDQMLQTHNGESVKGVIVTQKSSFPSSGVHFRSRYFAPWVGVIEDPVTGSAHTVLAPFWKNAYLQEEKNVEITTLYGRQESKRSGLIKCEIAGNRVFIGGKAKFFAKGKLNI